MKANLYFDHCFATVACPSQTDSMVWIDTSGLRKQADQEGHFRESER